MSKKSDTLAKGFALPAVESHVEIDENEARKFEEEAPKKSKPRRKEKATSTLRREGKGERLSVYIPEDLALQLRVLCAKERRSLSDAVTVALEMWLKKQNAK